MKGIITVEMDITYIFKESIDHYIRMIEYSKKKDPELLSNTNVMEAELGETWFSSDCPMCTVYSILTPVPCVQCPLSSTKDKKHCTYTLNCCEGKWSTLNLSKPWREWTKNAEELKKYIENKSKFSKSALVDVYEDRYSMYKEYMKIPKEDRKGLKSKFILYLYHSDQNFRILAHITSTIHGG